MAAGAADDQPSAWGLACARRTEAAASLLQLGRQAPNEAGFRPVGGLLAGMGLDQADSQLKGRTPGANDPFPWDTARGECRRNHASP
jgi:hypothetical protein